MAGKELDRLLKERFFQTLHIKWQRKLGAPKPDETFYALYDQARGLESREKQYSSGVEGGQSNNSSNHNRRPFRSQRDGQRSPQENSGNRHNNSLVPNQPAHNRHNLLVQILGVNSAFDAMQLGISLGTAPSLPRYQVTRVPLLQLTLVESVQPVIADIVTDEQLEQALVERRLRREQPSSTAQSVTNQVRSADRENQVIGSTLLVDITIEGVPVRVMVDMGAQSTIISRPLLLEIGRRLQQKGKSIPTLERPSARLYGKDGKEGGQQLWITAQLRVNLSLDGETVCVPVFVQPNSTLPCLLGMNIIPFLGIRGTRPNGKVMCGPPHEPYVPSELVSVEPEVPSESLSEVPCDEPVGPSELTLPSECDVLSEPSDESVVPSIDPGVAGVSLVTSVSIPSNKGCCVEAKVF